MCPSLCLHRVCSSGKHTVPSWVILRACQKCRTHSFGRVCIVPRVPQEGIRTEDFNRRFLSQTTPPVWLRSTLPGRVSQLGPGFRKTTFFSEAARAAAPEPTRMLTAPGGPVLSRESSWPAEPPTWRYMILRHSWCCLPKGGAVSASKVLKLV